MSIKTQGWPIHGPDEISAVQNVLTSGCTNYWTGTEAREFEKEFAAFVGTSYAIAVMNGTVALEACLHALGIGPHDEVIVPSRTFFASASCIVMCGGIPVIADVDQDSQTLTAGTIAPCITARTKAIIVVHLAGWPADMPEILRLAAKHNIKVIEDCAQAHGATRDGRMVGSWGHMAAFSFCQDKIMSTGGEGGMITTQDKALWEKMWAFKDHGKNYDKVFNREHPAGFRWLHDSFGTNWRMTEMQAAIGRLQLKKLPDWLADRKKNADILTQRLKNIASLSIPRPADNIQHANYKFYVFLRLERLKPDWNRERIMQDLVAKGVPTFTGSCSEIYLEEAFTKSAFKTVLPKPNAQQLGKTSLMFLIHPTITMDEMHVVADSIAETFDRAEINTIIEYSTIV
jgi:dTDP-4-amino-4,6-dideoxygalactose transaminase